MCQMFGRWRVSMRRTLITPDPELFRVQRHPSVNRPRPCCASIVAGDDKIRVAQIHGRIDIGSQRCRAAKAKRHGHR